MFDQPAIVSESVELPAARGDHLDVHRDFAAAIRTGGMPRVPARDARWSLELANAIVLSTHTGHAVPLPVDRDAYAALLADLRSGKGNDALTRIAVSNLAAPDVDARADARGGRTSTATTGSSCGCSTASRSIRSRSTRRVARRVDALARCGAARLPRHVDRARAAVRPRARAAVELASDWGAPTVRVFGGASRIWTTSRGGSSRARPSGELGVTVALETHDGFASAARVGELLRRVESPSFAAVWDVHHPYRLGESPEDVVRAFGNGVGAVIAFVRGDGLDDAFLVMPCSFFSPQADRLACNRNVA